MKTANLLAIDLGAESGRAILGHFKRKTLQLEEVHRFTNGPVRLQDGLHWDILRLWTEIQSGLRLAAQRTPLGGAGLDTWGVDFALLDAQDVLLEYPYHYRDSRTDGMLDEAFRRVPRPEIFASTGVQFLQFNSLYQLLAMVVQHSPKLETARTFLTIPDLFNFWMTGRKVCEFTNATTTQCYNPLTGDWARPMLERLGLPVQIFPRIVPPGTRLGDLLPAVAEALGIQPIPIIAPACHDTGSAVAAVPAEKSDFAWISSGTWSIVGIDVPRAVMTPRALEYNLTNEGGVGESFRLSRNVMGLWLIQECRRTWASQGEELSYDDLTRMADAAAPLRSIIDPDRPEFLKPGDMPVRIRAECERTGQPIPEDKGAILRCALESIALKYRWVLEKLEVLRRAPIKTIHIVGGGAKNRLLSQFAADACGRQVITGPVEATAIGNLIVQAVALGKLASLDEARAVVRASFENETFLPRRQQSARTGDAWDSAFERLKKVAL
jgi:rhamnulokinase